MLQFYVSVSYFFFSSRRRHTRFDCDWSSDVCSSDLGKRRTRQLASNFYQLEGALQLKFEASWRVRRLPHFGHSGGASFSRSCSLRSEERRVGKECRSRWSPYH